MTVALLMLTISLFAVRNWQSYTNTTHIFDAAKVNNTMYLATWGGLIEFDWETKAFGQTFTKADGLVNTDVRSVYYDEETEILLIGTKNGGISRIKSKDFLLPITTKIGLPSNFVRQIVKKENRLFFATDKGLSVFFEHPDASIPILEINVTEENGLVNGDINSLAISNTHVFCGTGVGLSYAPLDSIHFSQAWRTLQMSDYGNLNNQINSLAVNDSGNKLAIAATEGLLVVSVPDFTVISLLQASDLGGNASIFPVFWDALEDVWISYGNWNEDALTVQESGEIAMSRIHNIGTMLQGIKHYYLPEFGAQKVMKFKQFEADFFSFTWGQGFYQKQDDNWQQHKPNCLISNYVTDLKIDAKGVLWIANGLHSITPTNKAMKGVSSYKDNQWQNYSAEDNTITSNNILTIEVDERNRKWFGTYDRPSGTNWFRGILIFDDENNEWSTISQGGTNGLQNFRVPYLHFVSADEMWVSNYDWGVQIFNSEKEVIHSFFANFNTTNKIIRILPVNDYCFLGTWFTGTEYWQGEGYPNNTSTQNWHQPLASVLKNGKINDFALRKTTFSTEIWVAAESGLFMFNGTKWYRYGTIQKKQVLQSYDNWQPTEINQTPYNTPEYWYVEGQERLFGSATTFPRALYVDIYNRLWIATQSNGFTIFSPDRDNYKTYHQNNAPLLSNTITSFEYDPQTGIMYIGTDNGLNSVEIGFDDSYNTQKSLTATIAYPNPFHPDDGFPLKIINETGNAMPAGNTQASIFDLNGQLVRKLKKDEYQEFSWDGTNQNGAKCASGIYMYVITTNNGQVSRGKIILIR